jgi:AMP-activated protein kinase-like protein
VVTGKTAPAQTGPIQPGPAEVPVGESWAAANAQVAEENAAGDGPAAAGDGAEAGNAPTVDVVFSLPAEVQADRVALCGEFNDWSVDSTTLAHQGDGTWSVTVPLAPGTYRYKYLLDGETWENGSNANRYEENAYGTLDSVIDVS